MGKRQGKSPFTKGGNGVRREVYRGDTSIGWESGGKKDLGGKGGGVDKISSKGIDNHDNIVLYKW